MHARPPHDPTRGWTLIELLICTTLAALLLSITLPSFDGFLQRRRLDGLSAQLISDLQFLRSSAVARNVKLWLRLQTHSGGSCYLIHTGAKNACACNLDGSPQCQSGSELLRLVFLPAGSRQQLQGNVESMLVDPRQGTISPAGNIELQGDNIPNLRHVVSGLGRVRLCAPDGGWAAVPAC
ncbi:MAG: GspH/FimT family pseudopilin [Leptothrix sp. (in: b-proteobacteria)]